jgi:anti-anti-sigma regulatory factor
MKVKIDTKEKFRVITIGEVVLTANMTEELKQIIFSNQNEETKSVILNMENVRQIEEPVANMLISIAQNFYENRSSFVFCELDPAVISFLKNKEILELMNITPTESEASDMVQMEEIERELDS